ncbi:MAG: dockerin type I repeat-containing protein [Clostridia bacterium]|nr:dockerin type I repeat-containing protein [Clostridia bacterium]
MKKSILRIVSMVLSIALLAGCINVGVFASGNNGILTLSGSVSGITDAKIIADYAGDFLSDGEKAVLHCTALVGNEHMITAPTDDDRADLIIINKEEKTVEVKNFTKDGYTWKPAKVQLIYGTTYKDITLDANGKGSFVCDSNNYSIEVTYVVSVAIESELFQTLVNAPMYLSNGIVNMNAVAALAGDIELIETAIPELYKLHTPGISYGSGNVSLAPGDTREAMGNLYAEYVANGNKLEISKLIAEYNAAENKVEYMLANGAKVKEAFERICDIIEVLVDAKSGFRTIMGSIDLLVSMGTLGVAEAALYKNGFSTLENIGEKLSAVAVDSSNWKFINHDLIKDTATPAELSALNDAVVALAQGGAISHDGTLAEQSEYPAGSVTLKQGVDQFNVTVKVQANVVKGDIADSKVLTPVVSTETVTVTLDKNTTKADVIAGIKETGVITDAIAAWAADEATKGYEINETNYIIVDYAGLGDALTSDVTCTVTFVPINYELDFCGTVESVPYGYVQTLRTYAAENYDNSKSYDYKVNGEPMREGITYRVTGDTVITRTEGKATVGYFFREVIANSYFPGTEYSEGEKSILYSTAIKSDKIYYRTPVGLDEELVEVTAVDEDTYKVSAKKLASGLGDLEWVPYIGYVYNGTQDTGVTVVFNGATEKTFDYTGAITEIKVAYKLEFATGETDAYTNLPHTLVTEANAQKALLDPLSNKNGTVYSNLTTLNNIAGTLFNLIANTDQFKQETKDAAAAMKLECLGTNGFYILESLTDYQNGGLAYLYTGTNAQDLKAEIEALANYFEIIAADDYLDDFILANASLIGGNAQDYVDKIADIDETFASYKAQLSALDINPYIDTNASLDDLQKLASAIAAAKGTTKDYGLGNSTQLIEYVSGMVSGMKRIVVNVAAYGSNGEPLGGQSATDSLTFTVGSKLTKNDVDKINALITTLQNKLTIDKDLYNVTVDGTIPSEGDEFKGAMTITIKYAPKSYTVEIEGEDPVTIYSDKTEVKLPVCTESGAKYVYTVNGKETAQGTSVTFTPDELKTLFVNDTFKITREKVILSREDLINFTTALNDALKSVGISFSALENAEGKIVLVLNMDASVATVGQDALMSAVKNMSQAIASADYVYIGGYEFWNGLSVSIQTIIDVLADSDFGFNKIAGAIDANGNVKPMALGAYTVIAGGSTVGAELVTSTLALDDVTNVYDLYITMSGDAKTLKQLDDAVTSVKSYVDVQCGNGKYNVTINVPKAAYAYYLAQMAITGRVDLENVTDTNVKDNLAYEISLIKDIFADTDFTVDAIEATSAKLGQTVDLSEYGEMFNLVRKLVNYLLTTVELEGENTYYEGSVSAQIRDKLLSLNLDEALLQFIAEAGADSEGLVVDFSIRVNGLDEEYEAIVFDYSAEGITNKFFVTDNLDTVLAGLGNNAVVVLLSDVVFDKAVTINNNVFINLNGKTISGDMVANGKVRIVDSLASTECGAVNGNLSGNFVITGGKYSCDVATMLPKGYEVTETGYVSNAIYTVVEENGNITINLSADFLNKANFPDLKPMLVDVAFDVALNMFTNAEMTLGGETVYSIEVLDAVSYLESTKTDLANTALDFIKWPALTNFINTVVADVYDFEALKAAIEAGESVASYDYAIKAWKFSPLRVENGYITLDVVPNIETSGTISVVVVGTEDEKTELAKLCEGLANTVTVNDLYINVTDVNYNDGFDLEYDASADIEVDFSSNHDYAALIGTAVAYAMPEGTAKDALVKALTVYFESANGDIEALAAAIDNVTAAQFVAAIKALSSTTCEAMLTKLGLTSADVVELEAVYGDLIDIAGVVLTKLDITGPATKLSALKVSGTEYEYAFTRENVKGYNVDIALKLTLFSEAGDIVIEEPVIDLGVSSDIVAGWEVANDTIFVDITPAGWSVDDVTHIIFNAPGADKVVVSVLGRDGNEKTDGLIRNGDKVKVVASNAKGSVEAEYTVIIMGDTNADGVTNIGDAYAIAQHYTGVKTLDTAGLLAADLNGDGAINVGDTYKIAIKYTSWDDNSYDSDLENK